MTPLELYLYACLASAGALLMIGRWLAHLPAHTHEEGAGSPGCPGCRVATR